MANGVFTPYSTVSAFTNAMPSWVPEIEQERVASYAVYEEIYWSHPETFKLVVRGTESRPIYIPSGRVVVETAHRYIGANLGIAADPSLGSPNDQQAALAAFTQLLRREKFLSKYNAQKRYGIIRGDWIFHIVADPNKPQGSRISIHPVDPSLYFTVPDPDNSERILKVHLIEATTDIRDGKQYMKRQTYERLPTGEIQSSLTLWDTDKWFLQDWGTAAQKNLAPRAVLSPPVTLPKEITAFPVYHIRNFDQSPFPYGASQLRGFERLMSGINQTMSDEDITLALEGLGLYATDGGGPVDENGNETDWIIGPGRVVENAQNFRRISGVGSVAPFQDHANSLSSWLREASGTTDAAVGKVDVTVAESGVALQLQLAPTLAMAGEKDQLILDTLTQMFYDLSIAWFPVYEQQRFGDAIVVPTLGDKLPKNRKATIDEIVALMSVVPPIISATTARAMLTDVGMVFAANEADLIAAEQQEQQALLTGTDPFAARAASELSATTTDPTGTTSGVPGA